MIKDPIIFASKIDKLSNLNNAHSNPKTKLIKSIGIPIKNEMFIQLLVCCKDGKRVHNCDHFFFFNKRYRIKYNIAKTKVNVKAAYDKIANDIWMKSISEIKVSPTAPVGLFGINVNILAKTNPNILIINTGKSTLAIQWRIIDSVTSNHE